MSHRNALRPAVIRQARSILSSRIRPGAAGATGRGRPGRAAARPRAALSPAGPSNQPNDAGAPPRAANYARWAVKENSFIRSVWFLPAVEQISKPKLIAVRVGFAGRYLPFPCVSSHLSMAITFTLPDE